MFDNDLSTLSTADLLESAAQHRAEAHRLEARLLEHAQLFADHHHPTDSPPRAGRRSCEGRERGVVLGGDGCPEIAEFAPAEFGAVLGISTGAAATYIGQALALRHRFPFIWARVLAGDATPWRATKIATACRDLSAEVAAVVDKRLAPIVDTVTPYRLDKIIKATVWHADPDAARAAAEEKARERGVYVGHSDDHGTKTIYVRAATGDVIRFDATINSIADALRVLGDTTSSTARRATAIGIIADPHYAAELLLQARHLTLTPDPTDSTDTTQSTSLARPSPDRFSTNHAETDPADVRPHDHRLDLDDPGPDEPSLDEDADRDAPYPSISDLPDPLDTPPRTPLDPTWPTQPTPEPSAPLDPADQRALNARLAQIKHIAHTRHHPAGPVTSAGAVSARPPRTASAAGNERPAATPTVGRTRLRPAHTQLYIHLTDHTLATGTGIVRVEGIGPLLADQLTELVGHAPYTVKPVIDLNETINVDAYEIPTRVREHIKLTHPTEAFPYGNHETSNTTDLDHIQPYDPLGPPGQTSTDNLAPLGRHHHRVKTHGDWKVRRLAPTTIEWTSPQGFTFHVTPTGTTRVE